MAPRNHPSPWTDNWLTFGLTGLFSLAILLLLSLSGCKHEPPEEPDDLVNGGNGGNGGGGGGGTDPNPCNPNVVYFEQQILPLLISNCAVPGCHNQSTNQNDHIQITSYATLMNSDIIDVGDPFDSDLWEAINETDPDDRMPRPPQNPLTPAQIALISTWLQQGAQNNSCVSGCDTTNVTYSGTIQPIIASNCLGCHQGASPQGGLNFTSWSVLNNVATTGRLAGAIQHQTPYASMPPSGPGLSQCNIDKILIWVQDGAPNN